MKAIFQLGVFLAILLMCGLSSTNAQQRARRYNFLPPPEYDVPYSGTLTIWQGPLPDFCQKISKYACAPHIKTACDIYIDEKATKALRLSLPFVLRHELGHCNGWPADHPNAKKVYIDEVQTKMPELNPTTRWLPVYPPIRCITPDRKVEPCENRQSAQEKQPTERSLSAAEWRSQIIALIERNKRYPVLAPADDEERVVKVFFSLDRRGRVMDIRIISSSGSSVFDEEALAMVRRSQPFPPTPQELEDRVNLMLPVRFLKPNPPSSLEVTGPPSVGSFELSQ